MAAPHRIRRSLAAAFALSLVALAGAPASAATPAPAAGPPIAAVAVDAAGDVEDIRALQVLALQALQEQGFATLDPPALRGLLAPDEALPIAVEAGAGRLFVLHLARLDDGVVASLSEVALAGGATLGKATLVIDTATDADRALGRLAEAVVTGAPLDETARIGTVTAHEGRPFAKRAGEFLWGLTLTSGVGFHGSRRGGEDNGVSSVWGGSLDFLYEIEHAAFGVRIGGAGSEEGGLFDLSVRGSWLILDSDISPFIGGGLGISAFGVDGFDEQFGGHALLSGGVEFFRLHDARLVVGADLLLPFYTLEQNDFWGDDGWQESGDSAWTPLFLVSVGVLW